MNPRFSIVILTYHRDDALVQTLDRLRDVVKIEDVKIVLVDNNNDNVDRREFLQGFPFFELVDLRANLGVAAGRNAAMRAVGGDVVLFLDDDALLEFGPSYPTDLLEFLIKLLILRSSHFEALSEGLVLKTPLNFRTPINSSITRSLLRRSDLLV